VTQPLLGHWPETLAALALLAALFATAARRLDSKLQLYAGQSLAVAGTVALFAVPGFRPHLLAVAALTLVIKVVLLPRRLAALARLEPARTGASSPAPRALVLLLGGALAAIAMRGALALEPALNRRQARIAPGSEPWLDGVYAAGLACILLGLLAVVSERRALPQVLALGLLDNGLVLAVIGPTGGQPLPLALLVLFEALLVVAAAAVLSGPAAPADRMPLRPTERLP
jgi:hydrogenase-4 component E